jgi:hypothetical protein
VFPTYHYNALRFGDPWLPMKLARSWVVTNEAQPKLPLSYLGCYDDTQASTWNKQITLARKYGVDFFLFQYEWAGTPPAQVPNTDTVLGAFVGATNAAQMRFALNWVDTGVDTQFTPEYFRGFLDHVAVYLRSPSYLRIDNRPFLALLHWHSFSGNAAAVFDSMRVWARSNGFPDLYIVAAALDASYGTNHFGAGKAFAAGADAVTALALPLLGTPYETIGPPGGGAASYLNPA